MNGYGDSARTPEEADSGNRRRVCCEDREHACIYGERMPWRPRAKKLKISVSLRLSCGLRELSDCFLFLLAHGRVCNCHRSWRLDLNFW